MGDTRGERVVGLRGSSAETSGSSTVKIIAETSVPGSVPRFELAEWSERYGVVAGITARGSQPGRGFDLGLWSSEPVGEVMNRWLEFRRAMAGFATVVLGNQVHGVEVRRLDQGEGWIQVQGIDGWVTTRPGILLTVTVADCVPVYLVVPGRGVALLHAGWRGTAGGILDRGVTALSEAASASEAEIIMHCGIGICGDCYQVGREVMEGCRVPAVGEGPWQLDLRSVLTDRARQLGLREVTASSWCSAHHRDSFYSHRASGGRDGRMVAYLGMTGRTAKRGRSGRYVG